MPVVFQSRVRRNDLKNGIKCVLQSLEGVGQSEHDGNQHEEDDGAQDHVPANFRMIVSFHSRLPSPQI